jgi:hypothetical protein
MRVRILAMCLVICASLLALVMPAQVAQAASSSVTDCVNFTGPNTISTAIGLANSGGGTITFMCSGTIPFDLVRGITSNVIINANGNSVVFDGSPTSTGMFLVNPGAHLTLNDLTIQYDGNGAIAAIHNQGTLTANNVLFTNNGRAVYNNNAQFFVNNSTFSHNVSGDGGAIYNDGGSTLVATNNTFYSNTGTNGGAIYNDVGGIMTFTHNTFVNNTANTGGAIYHNLSTTPSLFGNLISGTGTQCYQVTADASNITDNACGSATVVGDLLLGAFTGRVVPLTGGSPAIDFNTTPCVVATDQLGAVRPYGAGCDAGSIEAGVVNTSLNANVSCSGSNLQVNIIAGDANFNISYNSVVQSSGVGAGIHNFAGPASFANVTITELGGDTQTINYGTVNCFNALAAVGTCDLNGNLSIVIAGDANFSITGTGAGLPTSVAGSTILTDDDTGPNGWTGVTVTEIGGDGESMPLGNFSCNEFSLATQTCSGNDVHITITSGDFPMTLTDVGLNQTVTSTGTVILPGPVSYAGITLAETTGDLQSGTFIPISCPPSATLTASQYCDVYGDLTVGISGGDAPFNITGAGMNLPTSATAIGATPIFGNNLGPNTWTGVTVTEVGGNTETAVLGDITCNKAMYVTAVCTGNDLLITILSGDVSFDIADGATPIQTGAGLGPITLTGPVSISDLTITETGGDTESQSLGGYGCTSSTLIAQAVCIGTDLQVTIANGDAPFTIDVNGAVTTGNALGVYGFTGPNTFDVIISEESGNTESATFTDIICSGAVIPPAPVVLSPDLTALGCVLTQDVLAPTAPNNTYCRVLMKNGAVINYSGAVPRSLVDLGVIYAVDVYRLEGGRAITDFGGYQQVCLSGTGRLFYLDARTSPRTMTELITETSEGMTCGWIPATGTLVLTR